MNTGPDIKKNDSDTTKKKRPIWWRIIKWVLGIIITIMILLTAVIGTAVWILTPERLTPLIVENAGKFINADVDASRIELTFWSTFPRLELEIDGLSIVSRDLKPLPESQRATLPVDADTLLAMRAFRGGINILAIPTGTISIYDVEITQAKANIVTVTDSIVNYGIMPETAGTDESASTSIMPAIAIDRFTIKDGFTVRYISVPDSMNISVDIKNSEFKGDKAPLYRLDLSGLGAGHIPDVNLPDTPFGVNGEIKWSQDSPENLSLTDFTFSLGKVSVDFNTELSITDSVTINRLDIHLPETEVADIIDIIPLNMRGELNRLRTDMTVDFKANLAKPYVLVQKSLPSAEFSLNLSGKSLLYDRARINKIKADIDISFNGENLDASVIDINDLTIVGHAMDFSIKGKATRLISDPYIKGSFKGGITFDNLPQKLLDKLPFTISGRLSGDADADLRKSYFTAQKFHKIMISGGLQLSDFMMDMRDSSLHAYSRAIQFNLGTHSSIDLNGQNVDSLLTASLQIDTIAVSGNGLHLIGRDIKMGVGTRNIASSLDTSQINPIGASIKAQLLAMRADSDSVRIRLRDAGVNAVLQRYAGNAKSPLLKLGISAKNIRYADLYNRLSLRQSEVSMQLHPKKKRGIESMSKRMQARYDSIAAIYPALSPDYVYSLARAAARAERRRGSRNADRENIDFEIDNSIRSWLKTWQAEGSVKAKRARLFTPYFPVRNRIENIDMTFSTDSIRISNTRLTMGKSDFTFNGLLSNISRALTSRRGSPIRLTLDIESDTVDIDDIATAMMNGAVFAEKLNSGNGVYIADSDNEELMQASIDSQIDSDERTAIVIPSNITAELSVHAGNVIYSDIWLRNFEGKISAFDGAVNLQKLGATTSMGSMEMSALYSAPTKDDLSFAAGFQIRKLDLHEFLHIIPEIDTILPLLKEVEGIITAETAMTTELDSMMNLKLNTLDMAMKISGDSLVLLDNETFRTISKWLLFKNKNRNMIDHMAVELMVHDSRLDIYPFMFDMDRYRFGVSGSNDVAMNLDYHIAVLKSPIPFKFGINIKGKPDNMKIRLGKSKFNEKAAASTRQIADTVRVNLLQEVEKIFKRGARHNDKRLKLSSHEIDSAMPDSLANEKLSHADSVLFIKQGLIEAPAGFTIPDSAKTVSNNRKK